MASKCVTAEAATPKSHLPVSFCQGMVVHETRPARDWLAADQLAGSGSTMSGASRSPTQN